METIKIPVSKLNICEQYCFTERGEKYYLAYENDLYTPRSVLWSDLEFINKHFSNDGIVTKESLNVGRKNQIRSYELCLKHNCACFELHKIDSTTGELKTYINDKGETKTCSIQYKLYNEEENERDTHYFNKWIALGEFVLCEIFNDLNNI